MLQIKIPIKVLPIQIDNCYAGNTLLIGICMYAANG